MIKNFNKSKHRLFLLFFTNLSIYFNYLVFLLFFIILVIFGINKERELKKLELNLIKIIPLNYYFYNLFNTFNSNPNSSIFWDMQNFLHYVRCNVGKTDYDYKFLGEILSCPETIGYGPLTELIRLGNFNIWETTIFTAILFLSLSMLFIFFAKENILIKTSILISPGYHFLFFSLNTDIYVVFLVLLLINERIKINSFIVITVLTVITLIKTYTVFLFIGLITKSLIYKNYKKAIFEFLFLTLNVSILFNHYFLNSSLLPEPISFTRSFGVIHDFKIITNYIGYDEASIIFVLLLSFIILLRNQSSNIINSLNFSDIDVANKLIVIMPLTFFINMYQNWGYKFIFNSIVIFLIYKISNNTTFKLYLIFINLMATTYYSIGWGFEESLLNLFIISFSKLSFYSFLILSVIIFYKLVKSLKLVAYRGPAIGNIQDSNI